MNGTKSIYKTSLSFKKKSSKNSNSLLSLKGLKDSTGLDL